jgi:Ser/Thr protein kinase RdoA (MazF antagonist)
MTLSGPAVRLHGGEESAAFRIDDVVVRVGPPWRQPAELEWCHAVARAAASSVPEAIAPTTNGDGRTVVLVEGRPVSVWPFIEGEWADDHDDHQWRQAPVILAAIHRALAETSLGPRPSRSSPSAVVPEVEDPGLDAWVASFLLHRRSHQPLHGDFYAGNLLVRAGTIVAVLDWDEALVAPPELELAWAAWEWGDGLWGDDFTDVFEFVHAYRTAGGRAGELTETELFQIVRARLQAEVRSAAGVEAEGAALDADDEAYRARQIETFHRLAELAAGRRGAP